MSARPLACDTSVVVAAHLTHHPLHETALAAINNAVESVPAHVLVESYSVLTRLPGAHRLDGRTVAQALRLLDLALLVLPARQYMRTLEVLSAAGIEGGAVYDGLVAATANHHGHALVTLDRRARATYDVVGVIYTMEG